MIFQIGSRILCFLWIYIYIYVDLILVKINFYIFYGTCLSVMLKIYSEAFAHVCADQLIITIDIVIIRLFQPSWAHQNGEVQF